jgi:hypothetical protein
MVDFQSPQPGFVRVGPSQFSIVFLLLLRGPVGKGDPGSQAIERQYGSLILYKTSAGESVSSDRTSNAVSDHFYISIDYCLRFQHDKIRNIS